MVVMYGEARALLVDGKVVETGMYLPILRLFLRSEASRPRMSGIRSLMRGCCGVYVIHLAYVLACMWDS